MRHPTDGTLRRLVDEPVGVADDDREHVAGCPVCRSALGAARRDAALVDAALDVDVDTDVDAGWQRLTRALAADERGAVDAGPRRRRLRGPVIAAVGVAALLAGAGAAVAADWLPIFRPERVAPVTITSGDADALPELSGYGEVEPVERSDSRDVADAAEAGRVTGVPVPRVDELPRGVSGEPAYRVRDRQSTLFTFSAAKAARTAAAAGQVLPPPPAGLDGSQFRLVTGPRLTAVWASHGVPALVVSRAVAPAVLSSGVPFDVARDYVLALPGVPADLADQLRALSQDGTTLPLRVPAGRMTSSIVDVDGVPATLLTSVDGTMSGVVWVTGGYVTAVGGSLSADEVLAVARGLR
jgi:hypothetical protein